MVRTTLKLVLLTVMVIAGVVGVREYERRNSVQVQLDEARRQRDELKEIVAHLTAGRRAADVIVTDQKKDERGVLETTLLFVEYAKDGSALPAKQFTIEG